MKPWAALDCRSILTRLAWKGGKNCSNGSTRPKNKATHLSLIGPDRHLIMWRMTCLLVGLFSCRTAPCRAGHGPAFFTALPADGRKWGPFYFHVTLILITLQSSQLTGSHPPLSSSHLKRKTNSFAFLFLSLYWSLLLSLLRLDLLGEHEIWM